MKNKITTGILAVAILTFSPISYAEQLVPISETPIIISEVQTNGPGTGTTAYEYIELYNNSITEQSLANWSIIFKSSTGKETVLHTFTNNVLFASHDFITGKNSLTAPTYLPEILADFEYTTGLTAANGTLLLKDATSQVADQVSWSSSGDYVNDATVSDVLNGMSLQRHCQDPQTLQVSGVAVNDYYVASPTPMSLNCQTPPTEPEPETPPPTMPPGDSSTTPTSPGDPSPPTDTRIRLPISINELFIDPESPLTDSLDEYVELYNPNPVDIDLSNYKITAGTTTKYTFVFVAGTILPAGGYTAISSAESPISLSNSGSTVVLVDDTGKTIDTVSYQKAESGQAWARNSSGDWQWTTSPTRSAVNSITIKQVATVAAKATTKTSATKKAVTSNAKKKTNFSVAPPIQLNEVFPDPDSPQTDAKDEFIELYNPHPLAINISDYTIVAGATRQYTHTFPEGSVIPPGGYVAIDSDTTSVSLSNSGATVKLLNNFDQEIDSVTYEQSKLAQSYAKDEFGKWQWTTTVTKAAQNTITAAPAVAKKTTKVAAAASDTATTSNVAPQPLPGWALAAIGLTAVCYAAYEYRFEARNYIYKLRANRSTWANYWKRP